MTRKNIVQVNRDVAADENAAVPPSLAQGSSRVRLNVSRRSAEIKK